MGWGILLGVLVILSLLPLGIRVDYSQSGFTARVIAGPVKIRVFPAKKRKKHRNSGQEEKTGKQAEAASPARAPESAQKAPQSREASESGGSLSRLMPWLRLGMNFIGDFRKKIRLNHLYIRVVLAGDDPCDLAVNYGRAWAAVGNLLPNLERMFAIRDRDIRISCDFTASETTLAAKGDITITFGRLLCLGILYGIRALKILFATKRKGGAAA